MILYYCVSDIKSQVFTGSAPVDSECTQKIGKVSTTQLIYPQILLYTTLIQLFII